METEPRSIRILRALADVSPQSLSTTDLFVRLGEHIPLEVAQSRYGNFLREWEKTGEVQKTGRIPGGWQSPPSTLWRITSAGVKWLRQHETALELAAKAAARVAEHDAETMRLQEAKDQIIVDARRKYGKYGGKRTSAAVRRAVVPALRQAGCTLDEIGPIFGVSREQIRLDLLPAPEPSPRRAPRPPRLTSRAAAVAAERERIRQLAIDTHAMYTNHEGVTCFFADLLLSDTDGRRYVRTQPTNWTPPAAPDSPTDATASPQPSPSSARRTPSPGPPSPTSPR